MEEQKEVWLEKEFIKNYCSKNKVNEYWIPKDDNISEQTKKFWYNAYISAKHNDKKYINKTTSQDNKIIKDVRTNLPKKRVKWFPTQERLLYCTKEKKMTPTAFYIICWLRKDRAYYRYGKVIPTICKEIYEEGYTVTHIKSINNYAKQIGIDRRTLLKALTELEEDEKMVFIKKVDGELFAITGLHFQDGEVLFNEEDEEGNKYEM